MASRTAAGGRPSSSALYGLLQGLAARAGLDLALALPAATLLAATVAGQVLNLGVQVLLARTVGVADYGLYAWAFTWLSLLSMLATFGVDRLHSRYVAEYRAQGEHAHLRALLLWSGGVCLGLGLAGGLAFAGLVLLLAPTHGGPVGGLVFWGLAAVPLMAFAGIAESVLRACGAHAMATWPNRIFRQVMFGLLFAAVAWGGIASADATSALACNTLAMLLTIAICVPALRACLAEALRAPAAAAAPRRLWLATSFVFCLNGLVLQLNAQLDMLLLGLFADSEALGVYGAVLRIVTVIGFPSTAVILVVQPMIARSWADRNQERLRHLVRGGARLVVSATWPLAAIVLVFAEPLLGVFGPAFTAGATPLRILTLGYAVTGAVSLASALLGMTGHPRDATLAMVAGGILTTALALLLIPALGPVGAATAAACGNVAWNLALAVMGWRRVGVSVSPFARSRA